MSYEIDRKAFRHKVKSSQINEIAFFDKTLFVVFHNNSTYAYTPFTKNQFDNFLNASSIGKHFHEFVKPLKTEKL
jgi:hypothetical protein